MNLSSYVNLLESALRTSLYFAPWASNSDNEVFVQGMQSVSELLDLSKGDGLYKKFTDSDSRKRADFVRRILEAFQLFLEMREPLTGRSDLVVRVEFVKLLLRILAWKKGRRLCVSEDQLQTSHATLPPVEEMVSSKQLILSDSLKLLSPLVFAVLRRKDPKAALLVYTLMSLISISLLEDREEMRLRARKLPLDLLLKKPLYSTVMRPPVAGLVKVWNTVPFLRDLNVLEYYLSLTDRFYYYLEDGKDWGL